MNRAMAMAHNFVAEETEGQTVEWIDLDCVDYDKELANSPTAKVASSLTDLYGEYGEPMAYTLWHLTNGNYLASLLEYEGTERKRKACYHALAKCGAEL